MAGDIGIGDRRWPMDYGCLLTRDPVDHTLGIHIDPATDVGKVGAVKGGCADRRIAFIQHDLSQLIAD